MTLARIYAAKTPKPGQDRKVAAIRDALGRRGLRVTPFFWVNPFPRISQWSRSALAIEPTLSVHEEGRDLGSPLRHGGLVEGGAEG
jgi:hypothetical protein